MRRGRSRRPGPGPARRSAADGCRAGAGPGTAETLRRTRTTRSGTAGGTGHGADAGSARGSDPMRIGSSRIGDARGCGDGAVAGTARARIGEEPVTRGRGSKRTRTGGYGVNSFHESERSTIHGESETLGRPHQVRLEVHARARCSRRALLPFETPFEPAFEPPIATSSESSSEWEALRSRAVSRVGIPAVQRLRGAHLDAGRGRLPGAASPTWASVSFVSRGGVVGRLAVALRHQRLDLRPRGLPTRCRHLGTYLSRADLSGP